MKIKNNYKEDWKLGDVLFDKESKDYYLIVIGLGASETDVGLVNLGLGLCVISSNHDEYRQLVNTGKTYEEIVKVILKQHYGKEDLVKVDNAYLNVEGN